MKTRTKCVIIAFTMIFLTLPIQVVLSLLSKELLPNEYCIAWIGAWSCELFCCMRLKRDEKEQ